MANIYRSAAELISNTPLWELAKRPENAGKTIVVLLPDSGQRYLTTAMYE